MNATAGRAHATPPRPAPPAWLEPLLRPIERLERRLRHIRPVREGGLIGLELARHRGRAVTLSDGTRVLPDDLIGELHLENASVRELGGAGWQAEGIRVGRADMAALARWAAARPPDRRPVAYHAETILAPFARWAGFELRDPPHDVMHRVRTWYLRGLLARWSPQGRGRLARGHGRLRLSVIWLSADALQRRFGQADATRSRGWNAGRHAVPG